jgi:hypothetical protein
LGYNCVSFSQQFSSNKQYFDFIWTCTNGGVYWRSFSSGESDDIAGITYPANQPSPIPDNTNTYYGFYDTVTQTGPGGMAYAWTGVPNMAKTGYSNPDSGDYCYIGWEGASAWLKNVPDGPWTSTNKEYGYFPYYFYMYLLGLDGSTLHHTVKQSLNWAAEQTFGENYDFENSILNYPHWTYCGLGQGMSGWWYGNYIRVFGNSNIYLP